MTTAYRIKPVPWREAKVARGERIDNWGAKRVQQQLDVTQNAARAAGAVLEQQDLVTRQDGHRVIASGLMGEWLTGKYD